MSRPKDQKCSQLFRSRRIQHSNTRMCSLLLFPAIDAEQQHCCRPSANQVHRWRGRLSVCRAKTKKSLFFLNHSFRQPGRPHSLSRPRRVASAHRWLACLPACLGYVYINHTYVYAPCCFTFKVLLAPSLSCTKFVFRSGTFSELYPPRVVIHKCLMFNHAPCSTEWLGIRHSGCPSLLMFKYPR